MSIALSTPLPTLLLAAVATVTIAGCGVTIDIDTDATRRVTTDTVAVGDLRALDVTTENGTIEVRAADDTGVVDEISIDSVIRAHDDEDADVSIDVVGDRLVLRGECDDGWFETCSVGFVVEVPAGFDIEIATDNGRVEVVGLAGDIRIGTDNGSIRADGIGSSTVEAHSDNGGVRLSFVDVPGTAVATTDNGSITIEVPGDAPDGYDVDAATDNGRVDVDVHTDADSEHRITARSDNGSIDIGAPSR